MGFLDFLTGGSDSQLKRHTKRAKNLNAQAEDREASLHWLAEEGSSRPSSDSSDASMSPTSIR